MLIRKCPTRSLLAIALAAVPLGAHATVVIPAPVVNLPSFNCDSTTGNLASISWSDGFSVDGESQDKDHKIYADVVPSGGGSSPAPFSCTDGLFSTGAVSGDSFSIDFGQLPAVRDTQLKYEFVAGDIPITKPVDKSTPILSDFNLYIDAYDLKGDLQYKDFVGVQVISPYGSALSTDDKWFVDSTTGDLMFDPSIPGGSAVINLLAAPAPIPEPPSLALLGMGLAGIASVLRRKRST